MKHILWLITLLILAIPAVAQDGDKPVSSNDLPGIMPVDRVTLTRTESNGLSLTVHGMPVSCAPVVIEQTQHTVTLHGLENEVLGDETLIDVQLTTDPAREGEVCNFIAPFSQVVELEGTFDTDESYLLTVNNFTVWIYLVRPGQLIADMELQQVDLGETELMGWLNSEPTVTDVSWNIESEQPTATISGSLPDGCIGNLMSYTEQDAVNPNLNQVYVFRVLPLAVMCPAMAVEFTATVETDIELEEESAIAVNNLLYTYRAVDNDLQLLPVIQRPIVVETVTITGIEGDYQVQVVGTISGNCGAPLQEIVGENGAVSVIEIFDLVPELAPCTKNLIFYDNTFTVSQMPVVVNGVVYFADETESNVPVEGNLMQVDTVVESVDVLVLESFPMQLNLLVKGYQPDGCDFPVQVEQVRDGNTVTVHIYREMPQDAICPMMIVGYEETIALEGGFENGSFTIHVNDQTVNVEL
jgi:hypothetical protein